jgi:H/ACA ribonucleoprotein complex subunit 2
LVCNFYLLFLTLVFQDLASAGATKRPPCRVLGLTEPTKGELGKEDQEKMKADHDQVVSDVSQLF